MADTRLVETSRRAPRAVLCLSTAAYLCGLASTAPTKFWLALPQGANAVKVEAVEHRWIRWSYAGAFTVGIVEAAIEGVTVRWTGPSRTVVDLVRYARHLRSLRPGVEAARRYVEAGGHPDELLAVANEVHAPAAALESITMLTMLLKE
ncbi:type IV toxin-antitoxin system AbiEi family antitoxin [Roseomonas sp. E05]|uniref:type IV toxin-antitoxin system AbiEi family antitoxin domain-containing protein n=1 Tax=Roseomonas sp. E05 TaxID=3046310 RepID=UPI0024BB185D|nr:type IV toxin-antitoxin system AbiEi family antitoxin [Roseomonas sp. E05]MDJ0390077.1 type IV toxin-antitoxin system AbiEi family antitoxin [Roseomonas sp. E05]